MNSTKFADYLAHPPESDLDISIRVIFQVISPQDVESIPRNQTNFESFHSLPQLNLIVVKGLVRNLQSLALHPSIQGVWEDKQLFLCSQQMLDAIGISTITNSWLKLAGKGIKIALLDSGIDFSHPDLRDAAKTQRSFLPKQSESTIINPHGTALAAIIGGRNGIAPAVEYIDAQVFDSTGVAYLSDIIEALTWISMFPPDLVLFGGVTVPGIEEDNPLARLCQQLIAAGMTIIAPAGNFGPEGATIGCPASIPGVIAVGAVTQEGESAFFSSRGSPTGTIKKPDLVLPGVGIRTFKIQINETNPEFITGTSAAAAICTGLLALILSGRKNIPPYELKTQLIHAAENIDQDPVTQGHGILNGITLARHFNLLHSPPVAFKKLVTSAVLVTLLVTSLIACAFLIVNLVW